MAVRAWGGVEFGLMGDRESVARMQAYASQIPAIAFEELRGVAGVELEEAAHRAPVDTDPPAGDTGGELAASGRLVDVQDGDMVGVAIAFGGPDVPYAIRQHQGYYPHEQGQREYLIDTIDASKRHLAGRVVQRIERRMGSVR